MLDSPADCIGAGIGLPVASSLLWLRRVVGGKAILQRMDTGAHQLWRWLARAVYRTSDFGCHGRPRGMMRTILIQAGAAV